MGESTSTPGSLERTAIMNMRPDVVRYNAVKVRHEENEGYIAWSVSNGIEPLETAVNDLVRSARGKLNDGEIIEVRATAFWDWKRGIRAQELNGNAIFQYMVGVSDCEVYAEPHSENGSSREYPQFLGDLIPGVDTSHGDGDYVYCNVKVAITRKVGGGSQKNQAEEPGHKSPGAADGIKTETGVFMPEAEVDAALTKFFEGME
jgi:hypothetical protein